MHLNQRFDAHRQIKTAVLAGSIVILSVFTLLSCSKQDSEIPDSPIAALSAESENMTSPLALPTEASVVQSDDNLRQVVPSPGRAAIAGQVVSLSTSQPIVGVPLRLARVFWNEQRTDGAFALETGTSPAAIADDQGFFVFDDLTPGDFVLVVGQVPDNNVIVSEPDGSARIFAAEADKVTEIGQIRVDLPAGNQ